MPIIPLRKKLEMQENLLKDSHPINYLEIKQQLMNILLGKNVNLFENMISWHKKENCLKLSEYIDVIMIQMKPSLLQVYFHKFTKN